MHSATALDLLFGLLALVLLAPLVWFTAAYQLHRLRVKHRAKTLRRAALFDPVHHQPHSRFAQPRFGGLRR